MLHFLDHQNRHVVARIQYAAVKQRLQQRMVNNHVLAMEVADPHGIIVAVPLDPLEQLCQPEVDAVVVKVCRNLVVEIHLVQTVAELAPLQLEVLLLGYIVDRAVVKGYLLRLVPVLRRVAADFLQFLGLLFVEDVRNGRGHILLHEAEQLQNRYLAGHFVHQVEILATKDPRLARLKYHRKVLALVGLVEQPQNQVVQKVPDATVLRVAVHQQVHRVAQNEHNLANLSVVFVPDKRVADSQEEIELGHVREAQVLLGPVLYVHAVHQRESQVQSRLCQIPRRYVCTTLPPKP